MPMDKLPIWSPVTTGYRDALNAAATLRVLAVYAVLIVVLINAVGFMLPRQETGDVALSTILGLVVSAVQNFFLTPIMIAVHRFILLDEVMPRYVLEPQRPVFRAFFGWLMALSALTLLTSALTSIAELPAVTLAALFLAGTIFMIVVTTHLAILFPAIAVEAPGAGGAHALANAWADSRGHTWRIFLIFLLASLPVVAVTFLIFVAIGFDAQNIGPSLVIAVLVSSIVQAFFFFLFIAIASRLFQALADRLIH